MGVELFFPSLIYLTIGSVGIAGIMFLFTHLLKVDKAEESEV
jgi:hypothetical protein